MPLIRAVCDSQDGLITSKQLTQLGVLEDRRRAWRDTKILIERARGVYSLSSEPLQARARYRAALLSTRALGLDGESAADWLDLGRSLSKDIHVATTGNPRPQPGIVAQRVKPGRVRFVEESGLWCASAADTLLSVAATVRTDRLSAMLDRSVHLRLYDGFDLERAIDGYPNHPGRQALEAGIARLDETAGRNRVEHERQRMALIAGSDLPPAVNNARLGGWEVDIHFPGTRAIIEADGREYHTSPAQIAADNAKRRALEAYGFQIMRVLWRQTTYEPEATLERARRFHAANLAPPVPGPPPLR